MLFKWFKDKIVLKSLIMKLYFPFLNFNVVSVNLKKFVGGKYCQEEANHQFATAETSTAGGWVF